MTLGKAQWSLVRKLKRLVQETIGLRECMVSLRQERADLEQCKGAVEASSPHEEHDLLLALDARLCQLSARIAKEERQLKMACKSARFLGAEFDRPGCRRTEPLVLILGAVETFPNDSPAFRVEEGVCCWAELYGLATTWIYSALSVR